MCIRDSLYTYLLFNRLCSILSFQIRVFKFDRIYDFLYFDNICARMRGILADVDYQYDKISYRFILNNEDVTYFNC